jgi:hypothetical protein
MEVKLVAVAVAVAVLLFLLPHFKLSSNIGMANINMNLSGNFILTWCF